MELSQFSQPQIFLFAVLAGILTGILYDVFRLLRTAGLNSLLHTVIQDIVFMCCFAVIAFLFAIAFNQGEVRFFTLLGHICGLLAYRYTIGILTGRLFESIACLLRKIKAFTGSILRKAYGLCKKLKEKFAKKAVFFRQNNKKNRKNDLQPDSAMVYNKKKYGFHPRFIRKGKGKNMADMQDKEKVIQEVDLDESKKQNKQKKKKKSFLLYIALIAFSVYAVVTLVNQQLQINQKESELDELENSIVVQEVKNKEISKVYNSDDKDNAKYIEKFAREEFDYANKDERIFINIAGD